MLEWVGARARYVLLIGCALALFLPALSAFLRPALPWLVAMVMGLAVARIDMRAAWTGVANVRGMLVLVLLTALLMPATALFWWLFPLGSYLPSAVLFALAPPISSSATLCFLMGFNARRALEVTLFASLLTPLIGPAMIPILLPGVEAPAAFTLMAKLSAMIFGGLLFGAVLRHWLGAARIEADKLKFDGISALAMVLFVVPLFDGVGGQLVERPNLALKMLIFATVLNLGSNLVAMFASWPLLGRADAGAIGMMWGNRTVALYLAALPFDPMFSLFVALYQFPMYATPLLLRPLTVRE